MILVIPYFLVITVNAAAALQPVSFLGQAGAGDVGQVGDARKW